MSNSSDALARAFAPQSHQNREQEVHSIVTAKVDKIEDDGTYRLKFLGMNGGDDDDHSAPARVMAPMAGGKRGIHFFPEKDDEVVVAFQAGCTNTPIILGSVWNKDAEPPDQAKQGAQNDIRTIVTRSGHELTFDDTSGAEKITLKTQGGHSIVVSSGKQFDLDVAESIKITGGSSVHVKGLGVVIDGGTSLTIKAGSGSVVLDGGGVTITGALVKINSGGSPGTANAAAKANPAAPREPDKPEDNKDPLKP